MNNNLYNYNTYMIHKITMKLEYQNDWSMSIKKVAGSYRNQLPSEVVDLLLHVQDLLRICGEKLEPVERETKLMLKTLLM